MFKRTPRQVSSSASAPTWKTDLKERLDADLSPRTLRRLRITGIAGMLAAMTAITLSYGNSAPANGAHTDVKPRTPAIEGRPFPHTGNIGVESPLAAQYQSLDSTSLRVALGIARRLTKLPGTFESYGTTETWNMGTSEFTEAYFDKTGVVRVDELRGTDDIVEETFQLDQRTASALDRDVRQGTLGSVNFVDALSSPSVTLMSVAIETPGDISGKALNISQRTGVAAMTQLATIYGGDGSVSKGGGIISTPQELSTFVADLAGADAYAA